MDGTEQNDSFGAELCRVCGKRYIDRNSGNPEEFMCRECRKEFSKLRVPKWMTACVAVAVIAAVVMCVYLVSAFGEYHSIGKKAVAEREDVLRTAQEMAESGKQWSALGTIEEYLQDNPTNRDMAMEGTRMAMKYGLYDYAAYFIQNYISEKTSTRGEIREINGYVDKINRYYDTGDAIQAVFDGLAEIDAESMSEAEIEQLRQSIRDRILNFTKDKQYDEGLAYISAAYYASADEEEAKEYLLKAADFPTAAPEACGRLAVYERQRGDFSKAEEWIKKGEAVNGENTELARAKATILLAKGEYEAALPISEEIYSLAPDYMYVADTYAVNLYALGMTDKMEEIISKAAETNYEFAEDFYQLINGEISVREYYVSEEE